MPLPLNAKKQYSHLIKNYFILKTVFSHLEDCTWKRLRLEMCPQTGWVLPLGLRDCWWPLCCPLWGQQSCLTVWLAEKQAPKDVWGASLVAQSIKNLLAMQEITCNAGDLSLIPGWGRSPWEGNGNPLQYSCLGNPKDTGVRWGIVHGVARVGHDLVTKPPPQMF